MPITVAEWSQAVLGKKVNVDKTLVGQGTKFASSASIVLGAQTRTKPTGKDTPEALLVDFPTPGDFIAIGVVQNVTVAQQKQITQLYEIGSTESYIIPGRTTLQASLSRVMVDGDSLMKCLYPYPEETDTGGGGPTDLTKMSTEFQDSAPGYHVGPGKSIGDTGNWFYIDLASKFFNIPFTLGFFFYDNENNPLGAFYLQDAMIQAHQISVAAQQTIVLENVSIRASKVGMFSS